MRLCKPLVKVFKNLNVMTVVTVAESPLDIPAPNFNAELPIFIAVPRRDGPEPCASAAKALWRRHAGRTKRRRERKGMEFRIIVTTG